MMKVIKKNYQGLMLKEDKLWRKKMKPRIRANNKKRINDYDKKYVHK